MATCNRLTGAGRRFAVISSHQGDTGAHGSGGAWPDRRAGFRAMKSEIGEPPTQDALSAWKYEYYIGQIVRELVPGERRRYDLGMRASCV